MHDDYDDDYDEDDYEDEDNDGLHCDCPSCQPPRDAIEMMKTQLALAVKKGAYLLDEQNPGWRQNINLKTLDISSGFSCVLGQVYGEYTRGCYSLDLMERNLPADYGFNYPQHMDDSNSTAVWAALRELWVDHILDI